MSKRSRSRWLAGAGALLLALSLSGMAAAFTVATDTSGRPTVLIDPGPVAETVPTFEDADGNGVDDRCQVALTPNADAATAALAAADLDANGTISVSEAAQSGWTGGTNCNHGGYVSGVANGTVDQTVDQPPAPCVVIVPPVAPVDGAVTPATAANAHGQAVSTVARSDAVGGKNCNHGGAVREAAKLHGASGQNGAKTNHTDRTSTRQGKTHGHGHGG